MTEYTQETQKGDINTGGFATATTRQAVYEEAELKYGPAFAQYCADIMAEEEESAEKRLPDNYHRNNLSRYIRQLKSLSQVCEADFFQTWGAEDKLYYMTLLTSVSNDVSQALQGSLEEISAGKEANAIS